MNKNSDKKITLAHSHRRLKVTPEEYPAVVMAFGFCFCLFSSYYLLRPLRDEMGILAGVGRLPWLFSGSFAATLLVVPLFGWLLKKIRPEVLLPYIYLFLSINLLGFFFWFKAAGTATAAATLFFVWTGIFNLFVVSVFWSFMTDLFSHEQSQRFFGVIAAGGSMGAIAGPLVTAMLIKPFGAINLLLISVGLLWAAVFFISKLSHWKKKRRQASNGMSGAEEPGEVPIGGSTLAGIRSVFRSKFLRRISVFVILYTMVSTILYIEQAHLVAQTFATSASRTLYFAGLDFVVNVLAVLIQLFLTRRMLKKPGLAIVLALSPALVLIGLLGLSLYTILPVLVVVQLIHRVGNFALLRPGRELLFTAVVREDRYKAKNFIDTAVYRGGDMLAGWCFAAMLSAGMGLSMIALIAVPLAGIWMAAGYRLGKMSSAAGPVATGEPAVVAPEVAGGEP